MFSFLTIMDFTEKKLEHFGYSCEPANGSTNNNREGIMNKSYFIIMSVIMIMGMTGCGSGSSGRMPEMGDVVMPPPMIEEEEKTAPESPSPQNPSSPPVVENESPSSGSGPTFIPRSDPMIPLFDPVTDFLAYAGWIQEQMTQLTMRVDTIDERIRFPRLPSDSIGSAAFFLNATYQGNVFGINTTTNSLQTGEILMEFNGAATDLAVSFTGIDLQPMTVGITAPARSVPYWELTGAKFYSTEEHDHTQILHGYFYGEDREVSAGTIFSSECSDGSCNGFDGFFQAIRQGN